jgi:hypothetical protein
MTTSEQSLKQKRQYFHQLLIQLGEARYKEVIVEAKFGVESTTQLTENQLNELINDAKSRLHNNNRNQPRQPKDEQRLVKMWRNKCLLVLNERGIVATPKDWTAINQELAKKQFQWVLTNAQAASGIINHKGLYAFQTVDSLKKLFKQLCSIRDNEQAKAKQLKDLALKN